MDNMLMAGGPVLLMAMLIVLALIGRALRLRGVQADQPPALLARLISRQMPHAAQLGRPGILVQSREAIETCRACPHVSQCQTWMQTDRDGVCPRFCPNSAFLEEMAGAR